LAVLEQQPTAGAGCEYQKRSLKAGLFIADSPWPAQFAGKLFAVNCASIGDKAPCRVRNHSAQKNPPARGLWKEFFQHA